MDEDERQRKLEAGRAKLASFRQKRAKSDGAGAAKKTQKRKGQADSQNDRSTQDRSIGPDLPSTSDANVNGKTNHEGAQKTRATKVQEKQQQQQQQQQKNTPAQPSSPQHSLSPVKEFAEEDLVALTGKEQLKQLQQAVEKRNEIIARLSSNLQEAHASRDQFQLEAQSLTGQIQALQRQLQQTSVEFLRIKHQSRAEVHNALQDHTQPGHSSQDADIKHKEAPSKEPGSVGPCSNSSSLDDFSNDGDTEMDAVLLKLRAELEEERDKSHCVCAELAKERKSHQHVISLLEEEKKGREEERKERQTQLQDLQSQLVQVQNQCLEVQQYKDEKEKLNREVQDLRERLQVERDEADRRFSEEAATSALHLRSLEDEKRIQEEEMRSLKEEHREEVERIKQLLEEREKELEYREEEVMSLKASKNRQNQARAGISCDDSIGMDEPDLECGPDQDSLNDDNLMERYLSSAHPGHSQSSVANESFEQHSVLDNTANYSFELNSDVFDDQVDLSVSHSHYEVYNIHSISSPQRSPGIPLADDSHPHSPSRLFMNLSAGQDAMSEGSEHHCEDTDLEKELLNQQCAELREELALKDRDLNVLTEEVIKSAEELEEARSRWAEVTEELKQALWELEDEKEKRRSFEEEMNLTGHEHHNLKNKLCALLQERENENEVMLRKEEETSPLLTTDFPSVENQELNGEPEMNHDRDPAKQNLECTEDNQLQTLQAHHDQLLSELKETKSSHKSTAALLGQRTMELGTALKGHDEAHAQVLSAQTEVERLRAQLEKSQVSLDRALSERSELESQLLCLKQNLTNLEEAQAQSVQEREQHRRKGEEMDGQIQRMEQVLEEELEQFENLLKAKDDELAEVKEKWEEERQEKAKELLNVRHLLEDQRREKEEEVKALLEKQVLAVEEATENLRKCNQLEIKDLLEKHQQEISELNTRLETELLQQKASVEEDQKRQLSLIKQVTERVHERTVSQLNDEHNKELSQLRESMEAAHQVELQQAMLDFSQAKQESSLTEIQASLKEKWESSAQMELDTIREQSREQRESLRELHQRDMDELKQQWETCVAQERASMEEKQAKEMQALKLQWEEAELSLSNLKTSLTETQSRLADTQRELASTLASLSQTQTSLSHSLSELSSIKEKKQKLEQQLKEAIVNRDAAARAVEDLVLSHKAVLQEKEKQAHHLEEKERHLQQEVSRLQEEKATLRQNSDQEVCQLWTQLESMRTSRQELGELKEQLLARSSRVDDIERLKTEFNEQRREIKEQNEAELESLRRYFEQRLRATEESYREEIALLQLRLVESALEDSVLKTADTSITSESHDEEGEDNVLKLEKHKDELDSLHLQLQDKHTMELSSLRSSMSLSFQEELFQVRSDLTDHYYEDLQEMKSRHAMELEQLRARLSESHLRELTRVSLEAAQQVEVEVEQRMWSQTEELQSRMTIIQTLENRLAALNQQAEMKNNTQQLKTIGAEELQVCVERAQKQEGELNAEEIQSLIEELQEKHEAQLSALKAELGKEVEEQQSLEKQLQEETEKLKSLQAALDNDEVPQVLVLRQRLEAQYDGELQRAKSCMATEVKELTAKFHEQREEQLSQAKKRFQEEKMVLEHCLAQKEEIFLVELKNKHQTELGHQKTTLQSKHSQELDTMGAKHKAQLDSLNARHRNQLAAIADELKSKYKAELVALEAALDSQRKAELNSLEAVFQETNQALLEAQEAEFARKHQEEKDELERRMLGNMDTLEATYLKEVQTLRDEMVQLEERHCEDLNHQRVEHKQKIECHHAEQLSIREELKKELAQLHMEKFGAMAAELSHVHKAELSTQKEALDVEHCKALESLKKQVLELEKQHSNAAEDLSHTYNAEKEQLVGQHRVQLQELRAVSARELEACRRELKEESSRQRQHFVEEVELLKVQSEEKLQDRITQLKREFEEQKETALEELRRNFVSEQDEKELGYKDKMNQLTAQLQQLDAVVAQLRAEVGCLQGELEGKRAEMETLDTLLQRREREGQEGGNLLKMLTDDLQTAKEERRELHQANNKLKKVLIEMVHSTIATEELIGQRINTRAKTAQEPKQRSSTGNKDAQESGISIAELSSEELELTQQLCESLLVSDTQIHPGGEETALNACSRLRHTVDALLELLNQANTQLEQTHDVHLSLEERFSQGKADSAQLLEQHKQLLEDLDQEAKLNNQLQLELHKAEGLLEGYMAEKGVLEESLQQKEAQEERLVEELEGLKAKLHQIQSFSAELENLRVKHQELSEEHTILLRQRDHLSAGLGEREKALLAETERLTQDRLDVQRQAEKDRSSLSLRLRHLERELEEQETKGVETEQHHKTHSEDLNQRVQALEKQLKHNRQFIEEQAVEREHERDEFQQEIRRLEAQLRPSTGGDNKGQKVESLQVLIKDKTDDHASLLAANLQAQRDLAERNEEIDKLAGRIRELEQALLSSAESNRSAAHLEQELHRARLREQELIQDKQALEQQQLSNRLQISALQSKLDETRHCYHNSAPDPTQELREALDTVQQSLQSKEQEVAVLSGQLEDIHRDLSIKEVELKHLTLQLEMVTNQNAAHINQLQEEIVVLKENLSTLTILQEEKEGKQVEDTEEENLSSLLLQEKNHEIDHLNNEIQRLEQELENTKDNMELEADLDDLRSQVEHLKSETTRVRQDKQEEVERLHEVISTLQAELATLGPNLHEVSDSQDGDSINPSPSPSPEPQHYTIQEQAKRGGPSSLKQELRLTHSASTRSLRSRLEALQTQLETAVAEKEALERLLLTQEEEYRGHGEELGKKFKTEREKAEELQGLLTLKEAELEELKAQAQREREEGVSWKDQALEANALGEEKACLSTLVMELQKKEQERMEEMETLKTKRGEMKTEMQVLRETSLTLERRVQEVRAEVVDREELVAVERAKVDTLEIVKEELSTECDTLRRRESQLQEQMQRLGQKVALLTARIHELTLQVNEKAANQEEAQKEVLTHAEVTLAKADAALREREAELTGLGAAHQALRVELTVLKEGLNTSKQRAEKLHEEGQTKDLALAALDGDNQRLQAELQHLQEDLAVREEELAYQQRELQQLNQRGYLQDTPSHHQGYSQTDFSQRGFEYGVCMSRNASLSSPEVIRRLECSQDGIPERFHTSVLGCHLSELSALNSTAQDPPLSKASPRVVMGPPHSRTITPDPATLSSHSSGSDSNFSALDSLDVDKELEGLDFTAPPSPLGSTSSFSAPEWASDGYGSNASSGLGARLRLELEQTERLDAHFIEYLRCRGMNPTVNTDSAAGSMSYSDELLSPELQGLLKKVYQESCRILTLSQRRAAFHTQSQSDLKASVEQTQHRSDNSPTLPDHTDKSSSCPPMTWQQEKRALQESVIALRALLCRMAQSRTHTDDQSEVGQLQMDGQGGSQLRDGQGGYQLRDGQGGSQLRDGQGGSQLRDGQGGSQLRDGQGGSQLRAELEENQKLLKCAHDTQQEQENTIQSLKLSVEEGEEALKRERTKVLEFQQQLEQERLQSKHKEREEGEEREVERVSIEQLKSEVMALKVQVEQEEVTCSNLRRELQIEQSRSELLETRLTDTQKDLLDERQNSAHQQDLNLQGRRHLEHLLSEEESRLGATHSQLADARRMLEEERDRSSKQLEELRRRQEADAARDRQFISDMRTQLEQERRRGEELAALTDELRAEMLQTQRRREAEDIRRKEDDIKRKGELEHELEARCSLAVETWRQQKLEASHSLEVEREHSQRQDLELRELKERLEQLKRKRREAVEEWEKERTKGREAVEEWEKERRKERQEQMEREKERTKERQEQMERERRQEKTNNKLCELELLRQQDQQRMQELQRTLAELERARLQMSASSQHCHRNTQTDGTLDSSTQQSQQLSSAALVETFLKENSELADSLTTLSEERANDKHIIACLERQLRCSQNERAKMSTETENGHISSESVSNGKVQRLYERYLRAESFRKALVYQKRYLLLLLGGFQECEKATICLIAQMGARPSPQQNSQRRPLTRFRAAVRAVVAISRMKFLTRKWQRAIRRHSVASVNGHTSGSRPEVLKPQQPRINSDFSPPNRETVSSLVPPIKSPFRLQNRPYSSPTLASGFTGATSQDLEPSLTDYIHHLERVQQRLVGVREDPSALQPQPKTPGL
ncbi:pericentrin isoform X2 [Genypterus blacodes]|uniref:pericentrin isoform X2 n=1 Tax=Genypterus blacodes TaxID=154954 RepID=UPI003F760427